MMNGLRAVTDKVGLTEVKRQPRSSSSVDVVAPGVATRQEPRKGAASARATSDIEKCRALSP
jgi:hypothetical protein